MTSVAFLMLCAAALLGSAALAVACARRHAATSIVYGATLAITAAAAAASIAVLVRLTTPAGLVLPIGLPWTGAHFRIDALSAFFLAGMSLVVPGHDAFSYLLAWETRGHW